MKSVFQDLRHGLRLLRRNPGFALSVVVILGLGVGASATIFSFISSLMIRPLAIDDVASVIRIYERLPGITRNQQVSYRNYLDWQEQNQVFEHIAVFRFEAPSFADTGEPERVSALKTSSTIFPLLRVPLAAGRGFSVEDDRPGAEPVVVLSQGFWKTRYGSDPGVVGRTVRIEGEVRTVIGVLATDPEYFGQGKIWMPLALSPSIPRSNHFLVSVGRLKPGIGIERAQADMDAIAQRIPDNRIDDRQLGVFLVPLHESLLQTVRAPMLLGMAAAVFLLLIACTNTANLVLARGVGRAHEMAIRTSLGASRRRIIRQLTTESVFLSCLGGAVGLLIAYSSIDPLAGLAPANYRIVDVVIDGRVLLFAVAASILSGALFGLAPALKVTRPIRFRSRHRVRNLLIVSEVALALVLLAGAGLLMKSYRKLDQEPPPEIYAPFYQTPSRFAALVARTSANPFSIAGPVRSRLLQLDPDQPVTAVQPMEQIIDESQWQRRVTLMLMMIFSVIVLVLSSAGLYGVIAYSVNQRQSEIGIRVALGAQRRDILRMAIGEGMKLAAAGVAVGLIVAAVLTRAMSGLLYGVAANDLATFMEISLLLFAIAFFAGYVPARRATKVDPVMALRSE